MEGTGVGVPWRLVTGATAIRKSVGGGFRAGTIYLVLLCGALFTLFPLFWMIDSAVKPTSQLPSFLPSHPTISYFGQVFTRMPYWRYLENSTIYSGIGTLLNIGLSTVAGFVLARLDFRGRQLVFALVCALLLIPVSVEFVPLFVVTKHMPLLGGNTILGGGGTGLIDTLWALILPAAASPVGIFLMRQFFLGLPRELEDAARVDGAGTLRTLRSVLLPQVRPAIAVLAILAVQYTWNNFMWPLIVTSSEQTTTLQLGITSFYSANEASGTWQLYMAAATITALPLIVLFLVLQRHIVETMASAGIRG